MRQPSDPADLSQALTSPSGQSPASECWLALALQRWISLVVVRGHDDGGLAADDDLEVVVLADHRGVLISWPGQAAGGTA